MHRKELYGGPGFLGSSSYNAVLEEIQGQIHVVEAPNGQCTLSRDEEARAELLNKRDSTKIKAGVELLDLICNEKNFQMFEVFMGKRVEQCAGCSLALPAEEAFWKSIKVVIHDQLKQSKDREGDKYRLSQKILRNTLKPIRFDGDTTFDEYMAMYTGDNLRWEAVGLIFTSIGLGAINLHPTDDVFGPCGFKQEICRQMLDAADACLACCDADELNDARVWFLFQDMILISLYYGDHSFHTWSRLGDLSSEVFALGMHQEIKPGANLPFFLAELRKRTLANIYIQDKQLATFTGESKDPYLPMRPHDNLGRPCRVSRKFCILQLPLDLRIQSLCLPLEEIQVLVDDLDEHGWNTAGEIRDCLWMRTTGLNSVVRESILELALGSDNEDVSTKIANIRMQAEELWSSLPDFARYDRQTAFGDEFSYGHSRGAELIMGPYLDHLYSLFLLERVATQRLKSTSDRLVKIARDTLKVVLEMVSLRGRAAPLAGDLAWQISAYGLPTAGVLALELLKQTRHPRKSISSIPRSEMIQNLSVFVAQLPQVVPPGEGNYVLLSQACKMLQAILDVVLAPPRPNPVEENTSQPVDQMQTLDQISDDFINDWSWFDQLDFNLDFWNNVADHPLLAPIEPIPHS